MRPLLLGILLVTLSPAQRIVTVAGISPAHRTAVDGKPALQAPLGHVYGLLLDREGRLLLHDESLIERLETDGTLLALVGGNNFFDSRIDEGTPASNFRFYALRGMAQDAAGALFLADAAAGTIWRVAPDGGVSTFARAGSPRGLAFDSKGNLHVADLHCQCIRRFTPEAADSVVYTFPFDNRQHYFEGLAIDSAGNLYAAEYTGRQVVRIAADGTVSSIDADLNHPSGVAVDTDGNLFIADTGNNRIRKVAPDGTVSTIAPDFPFRQPAQVLPAPNGLLYVSDYGTGRVLAISPDATVAVVAGVGISNLSFSNGDGGPALNADLSGAYSAVYDSAGNLYVADFLTQQVRKITPDGAISTVASKLGNPYGITADLQRNLYTASADSRVRRISPDGTVTVIAGKGTGTGLDRAQGDGGPAVDATLNEPKGVAVDSSGNVYIADTSNARLRVVDRNGFIRTFGTPGTLGSDYWNAVALDARGNPYVAITHYSPIDGLWSTVDRINPDGSRTRIAGTGQSCGVLNQLPAFIYDGRPATQVPLCVIVGLAFTPGGALYIPESIYGAVLRLDPDGTIVRVAGDSRATQVTDGGPALAANFSGGGYYAPSSVALDPAGNLYLPLGFRVRKITTEPLTLRASRDRLDLAPGRTIPVTVTTNFTEPFPYIVKANALWLSFNRTTAVTGESFTVTATALPPGVYTDVITIRLAVPDPIEITIPVTLTVPLP